MPRQVYATPTRTTRPSAAEMDQLAADDTPADHGTADAILDDTDELLDAIDDILETNVVEILRTFVQRGGQ